MKFSWHEKLPRGDTYLSLREGLDRLRKEQMATGTDNSGYWMDQEGMIRQAWREHGKRVAHDVQLYGNTLISSFHLDNPNAHLWPSRHLDISVRPADTNNIEASTFEAFEGRDVLMGIVARRLEALNLSSMV